MARLFVSPVWPLIGVHELNLGKQEQGGWEGLGLGGQNCRYALRFVNINSEMEKKCILDLHQHIWMCNIPTSSHYYTHTISYTLNTIWDPQTMAYGPWMLSYLRRNLNEPIIKYLFYPKSRKLHAFEEQYAYGTPPIITYSRNIFRFNLVAKCFGIPFYDTNISACKLTFFTHTHIYIYI